MNQDKETVMIVDDHPLFREGLKSIVAHDNHYKIVGEAGLAAEALSLAQKLKPDFYDCGYFIAG